MTLCADKTNGWRGGGRRGAVIGTDLCQSVELTFVHAHSQKPVKKPGGGVHSVALQHFLRPSCAPSQAFLTLATSLTTRWVVKLAKLSPTLSLSALRSLLLRAPCNFLGEKRAVSPKFYFMQFHFRSNVIYCTA